MDEVARLLNEMVQQGVITQFAVFGAVAQMRYTEAVATFDAGIRVAVPDEDALDLLSPIYAFCRERGYSPEGEAIRVGDWPVQFIPAFSDLTKDAMDAAEEDEVDGVPIRVVSAAYLAVIALSVGRAKDLARIVAIREAEVCDDAAIAALASQYGLADKWTAFLERFDEN